jgi:hypothetical protein
MGGRRSNDIFGFEDASAIPDEMQAADDKTLRLSSVEISPEDVDAFLRYQRALREYLEFSPVCRAGWVEQLAEAHRRSLEDAGLDAARHARLSPIAADFSGKRMAVRRLRRRLGELNERIARMEADGADVPAADLDLAARLTSELTRLDRFAPLERRHGAGAIAALREREDDLVALHEQLSPLLARG